MIRDRSSVELLIIPLCHPVVKRTLLHGSYVIPAKAGIQKKYKYSKFLQLKARFISLYAGFLLPQ
ncbi:MAG TPA: hypothetical protein LFV92_01545 [Rickettsia endosymbiont of Ceroptres masudai]|nr:hypothetical protein [Rickettsia endosymbiont of Ceroptres masudai]